MTNVLRLSNAVPREKWAERISAAWREQVPSIIETGNLLEAAKTELIANGKRREWLKMIKEELPFTKSTANKLIAIATDDKLRSDAHVRHLPPNWGTLYQLTKLTSEQFAAGIKNKAINPKMQRKDVAILRGIQPTQSKKKDNPPRSLDDWCLRFSTLISEAGATLADAERDELFAHIKSVITNMETSK